MQVLPSPVYHVPSHKQVPGRGVFRVRTKLLNHQQADSGTWTTSPVSGTGNRFHPRKTHRKSRTGCRNCKARKVKCDESRVDGCMRCQSHGLDCDYLSHQPQIRKKPFELRQRLTPGIRIESETSVLPWSRFAMSTRATVISPLSLALPFQPNLPIASHRDRGMAEPLATLYHFNTITSYTCGSPQGQAIIQTHILGMAMQTSYLMHALLGVASAHMTHLMPVEVNTAQHMRHKLADAHHWGQALRSFRDELSTNGPRRDNMDALLSTIMLVAIYQFVLRDDEGCLAVGERPARDETWKRSFVFVEHKNERAEAMKWLSIQAGFKLLLTQLGRYLSRSVWISVLHDADLQADCEEGSVGKTWERRPPGQQPDQIEVLFCRLCNVDDHSDDHNNPYYGSLEVVLHMRRMRPITVRRFNQVITFMGRVTLNFRNLLVDRDTAALLLLAHWLSLLVAIRQWWLTDRAERECKALVIFLKARAMELGDKGLLDLLDEPANVIGVEV